MTLAPSKRIGPYDLVAPLGRGGMGEVWRARDTRLFLFLKPADAPTRAVRQLDLVTRWFDAFRPPESP